MNKITISIFVAFLMVFAIGNLDAGPTSYALKIQESGSFISTGAGFDTNGDGRMADLILTNGKGNNVLGQTNTTSVIDWPTVFGLTTCNGLPGYGAVLGANAGSFIIRTSNGDLLYGIFDSGGTNCIQLTISPPFIGNIYINLEGSFTGGTGKFKGASGDITLEATAYPVLVVNFDVKYGAVETNVTGVINLP